MSLSVLWLANISSTKVVSLLIPALRSEVTALDDNVSILSLAIAQEGLRYTLRMRANLVRPMYFENSIVYPLGWRPHTEGWYQIDINAGAVLQAPLIFLIVIFCWPQQSLREFAARMLIAAPLVVVLIALDKPLELLGNLQQEVVAGIDPHSLRPLFVWDKVLEGGGSSVLALAFAAVAVAIARRLGD